MLVRYNYSASAVARKCVGVISILQAMSLLDPLFASHNISACANLKGAEESAGLANIALD